MIWSRYQNPSANPYRSQYRSTGTPANVGHNIGQWPSDQVPYAGPASAINKFMSEQAALPFQLNLPGYTGMREQQSKNILSQLQGEVPQDVINQIVTQASERGIMTGSPGGPGANAAYLRALGLTSIGQQKLGQEGLTAAIAETPVPEIWNPLSLYVPERLARQELNMIPRTSRTSWASGAFQSPGTPAWMTNYQSPPAQQAGPGNKISSTSPYSTNVLPKALPEYFGTGFNMLGGLF